MSGLVELRQQIDSLDDEILELLVDRFKIAEQVRDLKQQNNQPPLDRDRWADIEARLKSRADEAGLDPDDIAEIFSHVHLYVLKNIYKEKV